MYPTFECAVLNVAFLLKSWRGNMYMATMLGTRTAIRLNTLPSSLALGSPTVRHDAYEANDMSTLSSVAHNRVAFTI